MGSDGQCGPPVVVACIQRGPRANQFSGDCRISSHRCCHQESTSELVRQIGVQPTIEAAADPDDIASLDRVVGFVEVHRGIIPGAQMSSARVTDNSLLKIISEVTDFHSYGWIEPIHA
jgi:hypothetical protein